MHFSGSIHLGLSLRKSCGRLILRIFWHPQSPRWKKKNAMEMGFCCWILKHETSCLKSLGSGLIWFKISTWHQNLGIVALTRYVGATSGFTVGPIPHAANVTAKHPASPESLPSVARQQWGSLHVEPGIWTGCETNGEHQLTITDGFLKVWYDKKRFLNL